MFQAGVVVTLSGPISPDEVVVVEVGVEVVPPATGGPQPLALSTPSSTTQTVQLSAGAVQTEVRCLRD